MRGSFRANDSVTLVCQPDRMAPFDAMRTQVLLTLIPIAHSFGRAVVRLVGEPFEQLGEAMR